MFLGDRKPLEEKEFPDQADVEDERDGADLAQCPSCGLAIHVESQRCPGCGEWVDVSLGSSRDRGKWYLRAGTYLAKTLVANWLFWLAVAALGALAWVVEMLR